MRLAVVVPAGHKSAEPEPWSSLGATSVLVVHEQMPAPLDDIDVVVVLDHLPHTLVPVLGAFVKRGGPVLGMGPGVHALCSAGFLPGRLREPANDVRAQRLACCVRTEGRSTPFSAGIPAGRVLQAAWSSALVYACESPIDLEAGGQVVFRHCDPWGGVGDKHNPFAATGAIAGISNREGHVVGVTCPLDFETPPSPLVVQMFASAALWVAQKQRAGEPSMTKPSKARKG
ncbi:MAG: hypothetical protein SF187_10440 [Deltaproteobacteria bacterium]|nr:hypothetical protein [Deltaproteobacteria bacterium]